MTVSVSDSDVIYFNMEIYELKVLVLVCKSMN